MSTRSRWINLVVAAAIVPMLVTAPAVATQPAVGSKSVVVENVPLPVSQGGPWNVSITGTPSVSVGGPIGVFPAAPGNSFSVKMNDTPRDTSGKAIVHGPDPRGTQYAITSFASPNFGTSTGSERAFHGLVSWPDCGEFDDPVIGALLAQRRVRGPTMLVPPVDTVQLTFTQPYIISAPDIPADSIAGQTTCLMLEGDLEQSQFDVTVVGYVIPPS